jgi:kynurenine formamidase
MTADMPVYPGTPPPEIQSIARLTDNGFRERRLTFCSHTGTHMDAPSHLLRGGKTLDQFPVDHFCGTGLCIDTGIASGPIEWNALQRYQDDLSHCDFVLFRTGWGQYWGTSRYFHGYPVLSDAAATRLAECNLKGVGFDTLSVDKEDTVDYPVHRILLENHTLIIENVAHLDHLPTGCFDRIYCLPLHLADADGAPARVVAFI